MLSCMEDLVLRAKLRVSFILLTAFAAVIATLGIIAHRVIGLVLLACTALLVLWGLPYLIYATGYALRADASGLYLLWRGRERRASPWDGVTGMAWVQRYVGKGIPEFFVVRADDSTSRLPLYTKAGMKQADSIINYWRHAVSGLVLLDDNAPDPLPLRRAGTLVWQKWYRDAVPESGAAGQASGALVAL
jgi:hypothetical protein